MRNNIKKFTAEIFNRDIGTNCVVIIQNDKVIIEEYRQPYQKDAVYELFSLTKTITALVAGIAIDKGIISLDNTVVSFFPSKIPANCSDNLRKMTVHNLLSMTTGRVAMDYHEIFPKTDWIKAFLELPVPYQPGSVYKYSSHTSHMISAIIKVKTGMTLAKFADKFLFTPLDIDCHHWETWHDGNTVGGMGLALSTLSLSKIGQLFLKMGVYKGKRVLSEKYLKAATTNYILKNELNQVDYSDKKYGYSIEFHNDNYYHEGSFGQLLYIIPKENIIIAINSRKREKGLLLDLIDKHILKGNDCYNEDEYAFSKKSILPANKSIPTKRKSFTATINLPENTQYLSNIMLKGNDGIISFERIFSDGNKELIEFDYNNHKKVNLFFIKDTTKVLQPAVLTAYWEDSNTLILNAVYPETPYITNYKFELINNDKSVRITSTMNPSLGSFSAVSPDDICLEAKIQVYNKFNKSISI